MPALDENDLGIYDDPGYDPGTCEDVGDVGQDSTGDAATGWGDVAEWDASAGVDTSVVGELEPVPGVDEAVNRLFERTVNIF